MARSIKEVNGIKVVKRYSAGSIFSGLICFFYPVIAVLLLVLPWKSINYNGADINVTMLDTFRVIANQACDYKDLFFIPVTTALDGYQGLLLKIFDIVAIVAWVCLAIFAVFLLFYALLYLFRGKVVHFKVPFVLSLFASICVILLGGLGLTEYILYSLVFKIEDTTIALSLYWLIVYIVLAVLGTIFLAVIFNIAFKNRVFIGDLGDLSHLTGDAELGEDCRIKYVTKEVVKVKYEPAIGLPPHLSSIGGHAFSQNMNLVVAMIPNGIKTIGQGAFANCGRLKVVSIPLSVKSIGFNCFFNCVNLQRINYAGTKEQWRHVKRGSNWLTKAGTYTVVCADGAIIVNPYH